MNTIIVSIIFSVLQPNGVWKKQSDFMVGAASNPEVCRMVIADARQGLGAAKGYRFESAVCRQIPQQ